MIDAAIASHRSAPMPARVFVADADVLNADLHAAGAPCLPPERSAHAAHRCFVLAIRRTVSHNRDEFENGMWMARKRCASAPGSGSEWRATRAVRVGIADTQAETGAL